MKNGKTLYLVHCVDTEGPLWETTAATFECIKRSTGICYEVSQKQLRRLQEGKDIPAGYESVISALVSEERLAYKRTWSEVEEMVDGLLSKEWRKNFYDDFGQNYIFSWFVLDLVGFEHNPRRRALGYHHIYNFYNQRLCETDNKSDAIYWHYHPVSYFKEAHKTSFNFGYTNHHLQILSRRVIDQLDFPAAYRPGCHCERPDINLFLEQWIPFDYGNQGMPETTFESLQQDISGGRYGDWRRAPSAWGTYHPDFYDYQKKGSMRRYITRTLNLGSRLRNISKKEIARAFQTADTGNPTILSITNHDMREIRNDISKYFKEVCEIKSKFPHVRICFSNAVDAVRACEKIPAESPTKLKIYWEGNKLLIQADKAIWGPQPWFCFKTKGGVYIHENLDVQGDRKWSFVFDEETIFLDQIEAN